jgi:hypothetical protein
VNDDYQRAIAESDALWDAYQEATWVHGMAAEETDKARRAYVNSVQTELDAYDAYKGAS